MTVKEKLEYARQQGRHYIFNTKYHRVGEDYVTSHGYDLVFDYFMGVAIHEFPEYDAKYLREILENDGKPGK